MIDRNGKHDRMSGRRQKLAGVLRQGGQLITVEDAALSLGVSRREAAKTLWRWSRQGWLKHLRRDLYAPVPLDATSLEQVLPDPWILVPHLFHPAYVGGWSAAEHWGLTDQIFRHVLVYTARPARPREQVIQGITFVLRQCRPDRIFGLRPVWHGKTKIEVSDLHRTIIDMLDHPGAGGGIRHASDCLRNYLASREADESRLIEYADRLGNGAIYKRLGFLLSWLDVSEELQDICRSRLTAGNARLDPAVPCERLQKKWRLWIPRTWDKGAGG